MLPTEKISGGIHSGVSLQRSKKSSMFFGTDYLSAKSSRNSRRRSANAMFLTHLFLDSVKPVPSTKLSEGRTPSRIERSKNSSLFVGKD